MVAQKSITVGKVDYTVSSSYKVPSPHTPSKSGDLALFSLLSPGWKLRRIRRKQRVGPAVLTAIPLGDSCGSFPSGRSRSPVGVSIPR